MGEKLTVINQLKTKTEISNYIRAHKEWMDILEKDTQNYLVASKFNSKSIEKKLCY